MSKLELPQLLKVAEIGVAANRLRPVKADFASLYAAMLLNGKSLPPIKVRRTPNGTSTFLLVSGAHRLEAHGMAGRETILCEIVKADADAAREEEIEENLFRNELSALEKIIAVSEWRKLFEAKAGKVQRGGYQRAIRHVGGLNLLGVAEDSEQGRFYARAAERFGLSLRTAERLCTIARNLHLALAAALTNSSAEDNQSAIERVSRYTAEDQAKLAKLLAGTAKGDVARAEAILFPAIPTSASAKSAERLVSIWSRAGKNARKDWLRIHADEVRELLTEIERETDG